MPDSDQVRSAVDAAEQAATAGDFNAAARHLHDALAVQERELGPAHPDVASTLNNLGVVCERIGDYAEAERCYRRACEIVTATFPPEHPFVETSRQNLEEFCKARALPVDIPQRFAPEPRPMPAPVVPPPTLAQAPVDAPSRPHATPPPLPRPVPRALEPKPGRLPLVPVIAAAVIVIASVLWFNRGRGDDISTSPSAVTAAKTPAQMVPPSPTPAPPASAAAATPRPDPTAVAPPPARTPARDGSPAVVEARLCRALTRGAEWTCARASDPASSGPIYFYTRLTTAHDTTVVHRWYRDDRVQLTRELPIGANVGAGYRTYSHLMLDAGSAGQWRVELRTTDGRVLREERFVVR
jgi:hypothetical protein